MRPNAAALTLLLAAPLAAAGCGPAPVTGRPPVPDAAARDVGVVRADAALASPDVVVARPDAAVAAREAGVGAPGAEGGTDNPADASIDASLADGSIDAPNGATDVGPPPPNARLPGVGDLVIDEILANPSGQDLGREWIEIESLSADPLDLASLHVADTSTDVAVAAGTLAPGGLLVLGQSADPTKNGGAPVGAAYGTHLILNNEGEQISLCLGPCATGVVLDEVSWGAIGPAYDGHALIVDPATKLLCPATSPFGTAGDFGTPGAPNPGCAAPDGGVDGGATSRSSTDAAAE